MVPDRMETKKGVINVTDRSELLCEPKLLKGPILAKIQDFETRKLLRN
uniref:Uncharacterized protein n=1 Tax=Arundo donax TaxID=35708 RepID=A0A0A9BMD9_ARUDO